MLSSHPRVQKWLPRHVRTFDPAEVTTVSDREVSPSSVGLRNEDVEAIWNSVVLYYKMRLHPALGICIRRRGEIILDRAIGHARGNSPDDPEGTALELATPETLFNFFSGSKSILAMLVHSLHERGLLHVDDPVCNYIDGFACKRKHGITLRDILTHTAGIPATPSEVLSLDMLTQPERIREIIVDLEPAFRPGRVPAYHAITGGFILQFVIERVTGKGLREVLTERIREPMRMKYFNYGVPEDLLSRVAIDAFTGPPPTWPHKNLIEKSLGLPMEGIIEVANDARFRTAIVPSGNIIATSEEICRYFEMLLCGGVYEGRRLFEQRTIAQATERQNVGKVDRMLMLPIPYSMGFMLGNPVFGFYGQQCAKAFGHLGFTNVLAWADPERDISVAFMNTGKPLLAARFVVWFNVMRTISAHIPRDRSN